MGINAKRAEWIVKEVATTMEMEGMELTEDTLAGVRRIAGGETTADEEVSRIKKEMRLVK